jgi:hypothetical protein
MENANKNVISGILTVIAVLIVIGAVVLFGHGGASTSGTDSNILGQASTTSGGSVIVSTPKGGAGEFGIEANLTTVKIGAQLPTIIVNLPSNSRGKEIVFALKSPSDNSPTAPKQILFMTAVNTDGDTYNVSGLRIEEVTDVQTGVKTPVAPGSYQLEAVLWDRNPYAPGSGPNNATAVVSGVFSVTN